MRVRRARAASHLLLAAEVVGMAALWVAAPFAWIAVGKRIGAATGSLVASGGLAFGGFVLTVVLVARGLARMDSAWVQMRCRAGHRQREGALNRVVVVSATLGLAAFAVWYYLLSNAFVLPFMPRQ